MKLYIHNWIISYKNMKKKSVRWTPAVLPPCSSSMTRVLMPASLLYSPRTGKGERRWGAQRGKQNEEEVSNEGTALSMCCHQPFLLHVLLPCLSPGKKKKKKKIYWKRLFSAAVSLPRPHYSILNITISSSSLCCPLCLLKRPESKLTSFAPLKQTRSKTRYNPDVMACLFHK